MADGKVGPPLGNTNSRMDNRLWGNTIRRAVVQGDGEKLRKIADKLVEMAQEGDVQAIKEIGDRLDGKPKQQTELSGPDGGDIPLGVSVRFVSSTT